MVDGLPNSKSSTRTVNFAEESVQFVVIRSTGGCSGAADRLGSSRKNHSSRRLLGVERAVDHQVRPGRCLRHAGRCVRRPYGVVRHRTAVYFSKRTLDKHFQISVFNYGMNAKKHILQIGLNKNTLLFCRFQYLIQI